MMMNSVYESAILTRERPLAFFRARRAAELESPGERALFYLWIALGLLVTAVLISLGSLLLAFGNYDWGVFAGYLHSLPILVLNTLPVLLLELALLFLFNSFWAAALGTVLLILIPSIGNYYKILFRFEPFVFRDVSVIGAGLQIAREYTLTINKRLVLVLILAVLVILFAALLLRGRLKWKTRLIGLLLVLASIFPLWHFVYSDFDLYLSMTRSNPYLGNITPQQDFICTGFVYPFLFSITDRVDIRPEGYGEEEAAALIAQWEDEEIPPEKKVNVLVLQLESFTDLEAKGLRGVDPAVYAPWHALEEESLHGEMIANVIGGGTIDTERCLLTGSYGLQTYTRAAPSYVRYLGEQGYLTTGVHPNRPDFYNRVNVNRYLGFMNYDFIGTEGSPVTKAWTHDEVFMPEVFGRFLEDIHGEAPVFSFNVSFQGHSPYNDSSFDASDQLWAGEGASDATRYVINNYLSSVAETQRLLQENLDLLRDAEEPVLVLVYGDHCPYLVSPSIYAESGLELSLSSEKGIIDYYGTPWLLWGNPAAQPLLEKELSGEGPMLSPGYFMNLIFEQLGLKGSAFMQFTESIRAQLPVVNSQGYVLEDGVLSAAVSEEARELLRRYSCVQFYLRDSYER